MYYLIHTPHHPRPYLSTVSFIANDFASWGCRVTSHAKESAYMTEIRYQETRNRPSTRRIELMEVWAKEVIARKEQQSRDSARAALVDARRARASAFAQDFVTGLAYFEPPLLAPKPLQNDTLPLPEYPLALVARYTRLLHRCAYVSHAALPARADPAVQVADQIALEFRFDRSLDAEQLVHALKGAMAKGPRRMGALERSKEMGLVKVLMWVDVGDLVARECGKEDPVPAYEMGGWVWPPGYEECEG